MLHKSILPFFLFMLLLAGSSAQAAAPGPDGVGMQEADFPAPLRVLIDVRSNHSDGAHDFSALVDMAKKRGIDVLAFTEHDRYSIRLGIEPVPWLLGFSMQHPSLYVTGVDQFFEDLKYLAAQHPKMLFMAASESTPGYTWSGTPFIDLSLHNAERHIIALGLERAEQVRALPSFDLRHAHGPFALSMMFWVGLVFTVMIILARKRKRAVALLLFASFIAFLATWLTRESVDADADFIATAQEQGLYTIWAHPGTLSGTRPGPMGVQLDTPPYSERVFREPTANAFAAVYGDTDTNTVPGGLWDRYMFDYMTGLRSAPIWAASAGDYHEEGQSGETLGNFPMDVWAGEKSAGSILTALRAGHAVAWRSPAGKGFRVGNLYLEDAGGQRLLPGDEAVVAADVSIHFSLTHGSQGAGAFATGSPIGVRIIADGRLIRQMKLDEKGELEQVLHLGPGAHVLRLDIPNGRAGTMVANPFLLRVRD
ncbi:MAG: hypothetical protein Q9M30_05335 [Mariprofundaceae bacterium]|nr:hypothetical protein [Mariprofundaceae bacterium]